MHMKKGYTKSEIKDFTFFGVFIIIAVLLRGAISFRFFNNSALIFTVNILMIISSIISLIFLLHYVWNKKTH